MHILIVGERGVGKSTLIQRLLSEIGKPIFGFETKKEDALATEALGSPVYIYEVGKERKQTVDNLIFHTKNKDLEMAKKVFDRFFKVSKATRTQKSCNFDG